MVAGFSPMLMSAPSPVPMPKKARPFDTSFSADIALAVTAGWRVTGLLTVWPISTRSVRMAIAVMET